jgi:hypothetical protein
MVVIRILGVAIISMPFLVSVRPALENDVIAVFGYCVKLSETLYEIGLHAEAGIGP